MSVVTSKADRWRVEDFSPTLQRGADGIYRVGSSARVSYAAHGHAECFGVEDGSFWFRHRNACIGAVVARHPPPLGPILDLGGGNGFVAQHLERMGHGVVLLEPGETGAANACHHRRLQAVVCATLDQAKFAPRCFGGVGLFDVIEHIDDDRGFLQQVAGLLPPGGRLYATVPCHSWLWSQADVEAGHFRRYTLHSMAGLLEPLFRIEFASYLFAPLVPPQALLRALPYRLGKRSSAVLTREAEHGGGGGAAGIAVRVLDSVLSLEAHRLRSGGAIPFGASAIVAASRR